MELLGVRIEYPTNQPIVLLREVGGTRHLAIWIGAMEATAIAYALEGVTPQRPFTHDLLRLTTEALGAEVNRVTVTELRESVYYADLVLAQEGGRSDCEFSPLRRHRPRRPHRAHPSSPPRTSSTTPASRSRTRTKKRK